MVDRRRFLALGSATLVAAGVPGLALASAATDRRMAVIIQRGAADGLATLAPLGDPAFASVRAALAEDAATGTKVDSFFALHPALRELATLYAQREALFVHAVASPYRDRSHFDGQNILETGGRAAYQLKDGWLNRLLGLLPPTEGQALALSSTVPMILRGPREVSSYAPSRLPDASGDLQSRVAMLYESDPQLHPLWTQAMATRALAGDAAGNPRQNGREIGVMAAKLLGDGGARIAVVETDGWDTHANQRGRLAAQLRNLDSMVAALKSGLGPVWSDTLVLVVTEFGRTAALNGTGGTDHGTGALATLLGGAVAGGRVIADWPGLAPSQLHEGRDLKPTLGLDALIAAALAQHYGLEPGKVSGLLFPDTRHGPFPGRLIRA